MAKLSSGQKIQRRLVENITLLWTLCEVPGKPKENEIRGGHNEGRQLSLDRERQLVDSFAFISASTDDPLKVMAVCIEEDHDKIGMTIRLASNTGDLSQVTQGFNGIARTLEQASLRRKSKIDIRQDLFRQIVTLDEPRILSRLRSRHAKRSQKTRGKPELLRSLSRAVQDGSIFGRDEATSALISRIRSSSKELSRGFSRFETARENADLTSASQDTLIEVLIQIDDFDVDGLQAVLAMSPTIDPSLKAHLPRAMSKIGRYFRITCDLINAARSHEYTIFQRILIRSTEKPYFDMASGGAPSVGFDQAAQRVTRSSHRHLLKAYGSLSLSAARTKFNSRMSSCSVPWKVHAEIQLLLYYEQHPHVSRPRIISSNKSACYLCDLFIQLHGQFGIPRTHGRLYDRWILPEQSINDAVANKHLRSVVDRLNAALEAKIIQTLGLRTQPFPQPDESVLLLRQPWLSTSTLPEAREEASIQDIVDHTRESLSRDQTDPPPHTPPLSFQVPSPSTLRDQPIAQPRIDTPQPDTPPTQPAEVTHRISPGESTTLKLIHPKDILTIETDTVRIHLSRDSNPVARESEPPASPHACWVHVQWCTSERLAIHSDASYEFVDMDSLALDQDTVVESGAAFSAKELALQIRGHIVVIKYTFEDAEKVIGKR